jgi:predicted ribosome quality control (RQC) complex YloA/Tae2 family protein
MPFDTLTISAIRDELRSQLLGGRVQRVLRPAELSVGLEVYTGERVQLLLTAEPGEALIVEDKLRRGVEIPSPLELLLRKYVRGARLTRIDQPDLERILIFRFEGEFGPVDLVCEIMGRLSNVILLDAEGTIMEAAKRIPASINRYRTILPGDRYVSPPPQEKEHPLLLTPGLLKGILEEENTKQPLWRRLLQGVGGISPLLARELIFRIAQDVQRTEMLSQEQMRDLVTETVAMFRMSEAHEWQPSVAGLSPDAPPQEYAPYRLTHLAGWKPVSTMHEAIRIVRAASGSVDAYARVRQRLREAIVAQRQRLETRRDSLRRALVSEHEIEALRFQGNAILAMGWSVEPGQKELIVSPADFGVEPGAVDAADPASAAWPEEMHIPLDPSLSPAENAQAYFEDYRKRQAANAQVPALLAETEVQLDYFQQLLTEVELAEDRAQLDAVRVEMAEVGIGRAPKRGRSADAGEPLTLYGPDGTPILVGRNSRQNDLVTFRRGAPNDIWLHAHGVPGSHVIIKSAGRAVDEETLHQAARLAARFSAARHEGRVQVDYTERRHVRHIKGAPAGMVTYTHEETLVVEPADAGDGTAAMVGSAQEE